MIYVFLGLLALIFLFGAFYPRKNAIYKDKDGNQVLVVGFVKTVVTIQYVEYNERTDTFHRITQPQNISLWDFLKQFNLWVML